jgi:uncharacterized membrane protein YdjX (TVP38/TMEM64 family)
MWTLIRPMLPMVLVLAIPIVPFLFFGPQMEAWLESFRESPPPAHWVAATVIALLASDIFLPIPSSLVCTLAGWQLGAALGTLVTWTGLNLGAALGFALAKACGPRVAGWFSRERDLARAAALSQLYGPVLLALARGVPVLAEASVLWMGLHGLSWRAFLLPVLASNLVLALAYSLLGNLAEQYDWLPMALAASVAVPVALAAAAQRWIMVKANDQ